ncbi:hypothetical protein ACFPVS_09370 [Neisseria weixii]|uniref:Uncharacterized protein n=1 Tax=Neisseria weixii TaxID=1853276 RepID=A0A3N4MQQ6_9NEIS|nr:hypothetical protein [Neisseria weixii]RPD85568.1 hypothetical protein EGK74_09550 [Neisseria weixii]RPD86100.1 hypothetical protein EGK75_09635 [Neisseria weixii]
MITFPANKADFIRIQQRIALLEAVLSPEWGYRYFSFNAHWAPNQMMASMRDGSGSGWFALIDDYGIAVAARIRYPADTAVFQSLPEHWQHENFLREPAFTDTVQHGNFCAYKADSGHEWIIHAAPENAAAFAELFFAVNGDAGAYCDFAADYYEQDDLDCESVRNIIHNPTLSEADILAFAPDTDLDALQQDLHEIGITLL